MSTPPVPWVGIVIVHFGDAKPTLRCLRSIENDPSEVERSVVLVDNSPDHPGGLDSADVPPKVHYLACPDNPGFGEGANRGVELLNRSGESKSWGCYLILNHDVELLPGYLDEVVRALSDAGVGAAGGPLYRDHSRESLWYAGGEFRVLTGTVRHSESIEDAERVREVNFLTGAALAVSKRAWDAVGGFDPRFFLYHEDLDLSLRLRRAGWCLWFEPRMKAVHHVGEATGSDEISPFFLEHLLATRLRPHPSFLYRVYLAGLHTPYAMWQALRVLLSEGRRGRPKARAILRGQRRALRDVFRRSGSDRQA